MKKATINGKLYDVVDIEEYTDHMDLYDSRFTAIEGHGKLLPIRGKNDTLPGIYYQNGSPVCKVIKPDESDRSYDTSNIIDYGDCENIMDVINKDNLVRNIENEILLTKDNIFTLNIGSEDTPEMRAVKEAINLKQVDIKGYESRFDQYQNDVRLLKGSSITLGKLISVCNNFDIDAELTLKDKDGCVNPMNSEIRISLTEGRE